MKFRKPPEGPQEHIPRASRFGELLEGHVAPRQGGAEPRAEDLHGELQPQPAPGDGRPGLGQRLALAFFTLRKFHDPLMAAACLIGEERWGFLRGKGKAFISRCNLYDFFLSAERHLDAYEAGGSPEDLRCFSENFVKIEKFAFLHPRSLSASDERRLMGDRSAYLRRLNSRLDERVDEGRMERQELDCMLERSRRLFMAS